MSSDSVLIARGPQWDEDPWFRAFDAEYDELRGETGVEYLRRQFDWLHPQIIQPGEKNGNLKLVIWLQMTFPFRRNKGNYSATAMGTLCGSVAQFIDICLFESLGIVRVTEWPTEIEPAMIRKMKIEQLKPVPKELRATTPVSERNAERAATPGRRKTDKAT